MDETPSYQIVTGTDEGGTLTDFLAQCGALVDDGWLPAGGVQSKPDPDNTLHRSSIYTQAFYRPGGRAPLPWGAEHRNPAPPTYTDSAPGAAPVPVVPLQPTHEISDEEWAKHFGETAKPAPGEFADRTAAAIGFMSLLDGGPLPYPRLTPEQEPSPTTPPDPASATAIR